MEDVLLIQFEQIVSFCAIMYTNTNSLQLICENSCLNSANFTCRVIFREFYPSPKIFYTGVISDFCHKFHICVFPVWFVVFLSFCIFVFLSWLVNFASSGVLEAMSWLTLSLDSFPGTGPQFSFHSAYDKWDRFPSSRLD